MDTPQASAEISDHHRTNVSARDCVLEAERHDRQIDKADALVRVFKPMRSGLELFDMYFESATQ
jgi:hypothetical protein